MSTKFEDLTKFTFTLQVWRNPLRTRWFHVATVWYGEGALESHTNAYSTQVECVQAALRWYQGREAYWSGQDIPGGFKVEGTELTQLPMFRASQIHDEP